MSRQSIKALAVIKGEEEKIAVANGNNIDIFNRQTGEIEQTLQGHTVSK
jgi:peptide subunit release factor 1 (eRF1)